MKFSVIFSVLFFATVTNGYKILFISTINGKSHWLFLQHMITALVDRGHDVTCVTAHTWIGPKPANYSEVLIDPPLDLSELLPQEEVYRASDGSRFFGLVLLPSIGKATAEHALNNTNVQKLIHRNDLHFDLVINEEFFQESVSMFAHKFQTPLITISTYGVSDFFDRQFGLLTPWSHVPHLVLTNSDNMSFSDRWYNAALSMCDWIVRRFLHVPWQTELANKYFSHLAPLPSIDDIVKNVSVILINTHRAVIPPRPAMPGVVYIGGAHIKPPKALPADLQKHLDEAEEGVIYFSFGTYVRATEMPKERMNMFLNALSKLKQRVLWKFEDESIDNLPPNVEIRKWLPQSDILAHKNVVLFISHGGMFGHFEAIARGKPLLMIPFFGDQFRNAIRASNAGYAKFLRFNEITSDSLYSTIQEMVTNQSYSDKAKHVSSIYGDNLIHPMDEAMFWIEYVCRHKGAKHLKSHAINMSWFSYLLLDVLLVNVLIAGLVIFGVCKVFKAMCKGNQKSEKIKRK